MMKRLLFVLIAVLLLAACSPGTEETPTAPAVNNTAVPGLEPAATVEVPPATQTPEGYPGVNVPELLPTSPYPADAQYWLVRAAGLQCEDPAYPDLATAVKALEDAGVTILESEETSLGVCEACGCPTSQHFRVQVRGSDISRAQMLGWVMEQ